MFNVFVAIVINQFDPYFLNPNHYLSL